MNIERDGATLAAFFWLCLFIVGFIATGMLISMIVIELMDAARYVLG